MKKCIFYFFVVVMSVACSRYSNELEQALTIAKDNRVELEKVLSHYRNQPDGGLKYKAACFLIENMPYHSYFEGSQLNDYSTIYEALIRTKDVFAVLDSYKAQYGLFSQSSLTRKYDILEINSVFLIHNIDLAFKIRDEQPWGKSISFDDFCNYILPYRVNVEQPNDWRQYLFEKYNPLLDSLKVTNEATDPLKAAQVIMEYLSKEDKYFTEEVAFIPLISPLLLDKFRAGSCTDMAILTISILRALGIPCGREYMPMHGRGNSGHDWMFVLDKNGNTHTSDFLNPLTYPAKETPHFASKISRETFGINQTLQRQTSGIKDFVAPFLLFPRFTDVTDVYAPNPALTLCLTQADITYHGKAPIAYLCAPQYRGWQPVDWGLTKNKKVVFQNIKVEFDANPDNMHLFFTPHNFGLIPEKRREYFNSYLFRIAVWENNQLHFITNPFILRQDGTMRFLQPEEKNQTVCLYGKYDHLRELFVQFMPGGVFEASNEIEFNQPDTLAVIQQVPMRLFNTVSIKTNKNYRYVRYIGADSTFCGISEIQLFSNPEYLALTGKPFGNIDGMEIEKHGYANAFDGDPYTSFYSPNPNGDHIGIDLGKPVRLSKIVYTPRNRDNFIRIGDEYELFYLEEDTWLSLGVKKAESDSLIYNNVPSNVLFYLKNHTRGKDERVFIYEDHTQIFL